MADFAENFIKNTPKISVLTPVYNTNPEHLKEMINSVLNQSFQNFEFLILNDSPENIEIENIIKSYKDERIKYFKNEKNEGISAARNSLLAAASGEYIAVLDHDDICLPQRFEKQAEYLDKHPDTGVCGCNYRTIHSNRISSFPEKNADIKKELVIEGLVIVHSGSMIRKSVLLDNNIKWEAEYSPCEDYMLWARLIDKTMFYNLPDVLLLYRDSNENTTSRQQEKMADRTDKIRNYLHREYPYYKSLSGRKSYIYLFGCIPFIKKVCRANTVKYLLFGSIPLLKIVK